MLDAKKYELIIDNKHPSPNYNQRISTLVLHYTALDLKTSLQVLTDPKNAVSAHYLVPETSINQERKVYQLVQEDKRAYHAGKSYWQGRYNLNDSSIGIEIVNLGYQDENGKRKWFPFSDYQIMSVITLSKLIIDRYQIHPSCIIGHSDIAPNRKVDPGPLFPWQTLYEHGIGAWFDENEIAISNATSNDINILSLQKDLKIYGYDIELTGKLDIQTQTILQAFQMHFRPKDYSGKPDFQTCAILKNLIQKYFSK